MAVIFSCFWCWCVILSSAVIPKMVKLGGKGLLRRSRIRVLNVVGVKGLLSWGEEERGVELNDSMALIPGPGGHRSQQAFSRFWSRWFLSTLKAFRPKPYLLQVLIKPANRSPSPLPMFSASTKNYETGVPPNPPPLSLSLSLSLSLAPP